MYHCHLWFYLIGHHSELFKPLKEMSPLESFSHGFWEGVKPDESLAKKADVIFADLRGMDEAESIRMLTEWKKPEAELILLADKQQAAVLGEKLFDATDLWSLPMSEEELSFHFLRWQQS